VAREAADIILFKVRHPDHPRGLELGPSYAPNDQTKSVLGLFFIMRPLCRWPPWDI